MFNEKCIFAIHVSRPLYRTHPNPLQHLCHIALGQNTVS